MLQHILVLKGLDRRQPDIANPLRRRRCVVARVHRQDDGGYIVERTAQISCVAEDVNVLAEHGGGVDGEDDLGPAARAYVGCASGACGSVSARGVVAGAVALSGRDFGVCEGGSGAPGWWEIACSPSGHSDEGGEGPCEF